MVYTLRFSLQNAVCFIILTYMVPVLFTFYIQGVQKIKKKIIPAPKGYEIACIAYHTFFSDVRPTTVNLLSMIIDYNA